MRDPDISNELTYVSQTLIDVDRQLGTSTLRDTVGEIFETTDMPEGRKLQLIVKSIASQIKEKIMYLDTISISLQPVVQFVLKLAKDDHDELCEMIVSELESKMFRFLSLQMFMPGRKTRFEMIRDAIYLICEIDQTVLHQLAAKEDDKSQLMLCHILDLLSGCDVINNQDSEGKTALFVAVESMALKNAVTLLANGADPNMKNRQGVSPLEIATRGCLSLTRLLLLYDADILPLNGNVYADDIEQCVNLIREQRQFVDELSKGAKVSLKWDENTDIINALSIDGGGIRGLVSAQILIEIDNMFGSEVIHSFSWTAGTSTGSILSLALSLGKTSAQCRNIYLRLKDKVFVKTWTRKIAPLLVNYPSRPLEQFLKIEFGRYTKMASIRHKRVMVTSSNFDKQPIQPVIFRNYPSDNLPYAAERWQEPNNILIWLAARCSSAAPYYFNYVEHFSSAGRLMDGGLVANNPTRLLLLDIEGETKKTGKQLGCVLSLGTGHPRTISVEPRIQRPPWLRHMAELMRIKDVLLDRATDSNTMCITDQRTSWHLDGKYFRFSPELEKDIKLDETDDVRIIDLMWDTKVFVYKQKRHELGRLYKYLSGMQTDVGEPFEKADSVSNISYESVTLEHVRMTFVPTYRAQLAEHETYAPADLADVSPGVVFELKCSCGAVYLSETSSDVCGAVSALFRINRHPEQAPSHPLSVHRAEEHSDSAPFLEVRIHKEGIAKESDRKALIATVLNHYMETQKSLIN